MSSWGSENIPENILELYKTLQYEGDLLLPTREKEVAVFKMTANNTKKTLIVGNFGCLQ